MGSALIFELAPGLSKWAKSKMFVVLNKKVAPIFSRVREGQKLPFLKDY